MQGGANVYRKYISAVRPHEGYILEIEYVSGSRLFLDMKPHLHKLRFHPLTDAAIWNSAATEGIFVRFGALSAGEVELSHDEILSMVETIE